jgi:hypothetical protein
LLRQQLLLLRRLRLRLMLLRRLRLRLMLLRRLRLRLLLLRGSAFFTSGPFRVELAPFGVAGLARSLRRLPLVLGRRTWLLLPLLVFLAPVRWAGIGAVRAVVVVVVARSGAVVSWPRSGTGVVRWPVVAAVRLSVRVLTISFVVIPVPVVVVERSLFRRRRVAATTVRGSSPLHRSLGVLNKKSVRF